MHCTSEAIRKKHPNKLVLRLELRLTEELINARGAVKINFTFDYRSK